MKISSTADIPDELLAGLLADIDSVVVAELDEYRVYFKSAEPPSWIALFDSSAAWWTAVGVAAGSFLRGIFEEAGRDAWKKRTAIARALADPVSTRLRQLATALAQFRSTVDGRTSVVVGLPKPDDYFGTRLLLQATSPEDIALEIALFVQHVRAVEALVSELEQGKDRPLAAIILEIQPDGAMLIQWTGAESLETFSRRISSPTP